MTGLVGHGADRHDVGAGTRVRAAEPALQDVVPHLQELAGVARQRILRLISRRQRTAVRPQMVLRSAFRSALTADRGLHEKHQTDHTAGRVVAELCEVHLRIHECERFAQRRLQSGVRRPAPDAITVRRAERIRLLAGGAGPAGVARLRLAERHPAVRHALHVEQPVGHLAVEAVVAVRPPERRRGAEQHGIVSGRGKRGRRRARVAEQHGRHSERAGNRRGARGRHPRGERRVQGPELPLREQAGSHGAHRAGLLAPDPVGTEIAAGRLAARRARLLRACRPWRAPHEQEPQRQQTMLRHRVPYPTTPAAAVRSLTPRRASSKPSPMKPITPPTTFVS